MSEYQIMSQKVRNMEDQVLIIVWQALCRIGWEPGEVYNSEMTMDDWAEMIYSEMSHRGISAIEVAA